tara:strand:+ start:110 stop:316 length:207 start_codon:yes stop_codon:yes gene_type:complete
VIGISYIAVTAAKTFSVPNCPIQGPLVNIANMDTSPVNQTTLGDSAPDTGRTGSYQDPLLGGHWLSTS